MRKSIVLAPVLLALGACGSVDDANERQPVAVIEGTLLQADVSLSGKDVRVAIVWGGGQASPFRTAQDVKVTPVFPSKFRLTLDGPPPSEMMSPYSNPRGNPPEPPLSGATGSIVAYEDGNGNGKLDLVDADATSADDRVLGVSPFTLMYLEGEKPTTDEAIRYSGWNLLWALGQLPNPGYNFLDLRWPGLDDYPFVPIGTNPAPGYVPATDPLPPPARGWLRTETPVDLTLSADPSFAPKMCKNDVTSDPIPLRGKPADVTYPDAPGPNGYPKPTDRVYCADDNSYYIVATCTTTHTGLCGLHLTTCTGAGYSKPAGATPPGYPCK